MSDSTPTTKLETVSDGEKNSRTLLYALIGVGALLLIAIIVLIVTLLNGPAAPTETASPTPTVSSPSPTPTEDSASPTPTPSATEAEEEPAPPPPAPAPVPGFDSFSATQDAGCQAGDTQKPLTFSWSSDDAVRAYIGVQTNNAKAAPYEGNLPPVYTYTNINYNCEQASQYYTVTLEDGAGHLTHKTVTITK